MKIIVTIPAYNEAKIIGSVISDIHKVMKKNKYNYKILVVDDGSKDKTAEIAQKNGALVIRHNRNLGLAETFKTEMRECLAFNPDVIVHTDADGQYPVEYIPKLIEKIEQGYDLVLGSRFGKGKYKGSLMKKIGNKSFARVFSSLLRIRIYDTTTGFRAFTAEVAQLPFINSFTYTQEQLIRAGKAKMKITEVPVITNKTRRSKLFKNPFDYAVRSWINIFRIYRDFAPLKFFGGIGLSFILIGFIFGLYLVYNWVVFGNIGHLPLTILTMLLILAGIQVILFGFLADMYRK